MRLYTLIITTLFPAFLTAQIVNIESQRYQTDTTGWAGNFGANFLFQKSTIEVLNAGANAHVQYKTPKDLYLFLASYNFLKGSDQTLADNLFYHLRYNHKLNSWLRWEVFTQLQKNSITGINVRVLAGTGPRFKIIKNKKIAFYAGTAAMYEYEKEETIPPVYHHDIRSSTYITSTWKPSDHVEIVGTLFYQPLYNQINDFRVLNEINAKFEIIKHLSFVAGWYYLYDSKPAASTPKLNYSISNGVEYEF